MRAQPQTLNRYWLDRDGAVDVIADVWGLAIAEPAGWRIDRFGSDMATSIENVSTVVFSRHRGLVHGPAGEVRVFPIVEPDPHLMPALVCVDTGSGPMQSIGIENLPDVLPDPWGCSPETVLAALERLLEIASDIHFGGIGNGAAPQTAPVASEEAPAQSHYPSAGVGHPIG